MPYLLLVIGVVIGLFALYRFFVNADVAQVKALFLTAFFSVVVIALLVLALTGRLPAALGLLGALVPLGIAYLRDRHKAKKSSDEIIDVTAEAVEEDVDEDNDDNDDGP